MHLDADEAMSRCVSASLQIRHQYVKQRKDFGRHPRFRDEGAEV